MATVTVDQVQAISPSAIKNIHRLNISTYHIKYGEDFVFHIME